MKRLLCGVFLLLLSVSAQAADVGVSVRIGEPGFYGRIEIGDFPKPEVIYERPVVIYAPPPERAEQPIYLRVPPGHAKKWHKHCHKYNACDKPVYFVRDRWYNEVYVPHYRERERHKHHHGPKEHRKERHDEKPRDREPVKAGDRGHGERGYR